MPFNFHSMVYLNQRRSIGRYAKLAVKIIFLCSLFVRFSALLAQNSQDANWIDVAELQDFLSIGSRLQVLADPTGTITIGDLYSAAYADSWQDSPGEKPNFGITPVTYWVKINLQNTGSTARPVYLELDYPLLDYVDYYSRNQLQPRFMTGDLRDYFKRDLRHNNFVFRETVASGESLEILLRLQSQGSMQFPFIVWQPEAFLEADHQTQFILGIYFGIMIVMILYNLFLFVSVRDLSYLFYILYITCLMMFQLTYNGKAFELIWPHAPHFVNTILPSWIGGVLLFGTLFTRSFFETRERMPRIDKVLLALIVYLLVICALPLIASYKFVVTLATASAIPFAILVYSTAILGLKRRFKPARYFLSAWTVFLGGVLLISLKQFGFLPSNLLTNYGIQVGSAMEVVLLSLALADRINTLKDEKQAAQKMANLGQMAAGIVHDIKNPLGIITGYTEYLTEELSEKSELRDYANSIALEVDIINNMVYDILDFSKGQISLDTESVDVKLFLEDVAKSLRIAMHKNVELVVSAVQSCFMEIDCKRFRRVIFNLAQNAQEAIVGPGVFKIDFTVAGKFAEFRFRDDGPGIPLGVQGTLFQPFSSFGKKYGTGLGLAVSRSIVEAHAGSIEFETDFNQGTTFIIRLPLRSAS